MGPLSGASIPAGSEKLETDFLKDAVGLAKTGKNAEAIEVFTRGISAWPASTKLRQGKASALHAMHRYEDEWAIDTDLLALAPSNHQLLLHLTALAPYLQSDSALSHLYALAKHYPQFGPIYAQIAAVEAGVNELPAAIAALTQAAQLEPNNGRYRLNLAILQDRAGLSADAIGSYQTALDLLGKNLPISADQIAKRIEFLSGR
jgi:tetratricopeptide (TPR) repeat protein